MPNGGVVRVSADNLTLEADTPIALPPGRYCRVTVKDHGIGIKPEHLGKVFDPYFTTKEKGTGLGLATSYSIVKKHDGIMTLDSTVGVGSEFHVYLPASEKQVKPAAPEPAAPVQGQGRVLVMDDEELIRELAQTALEFLGYQVDTVADGEACIAAYTRAQQEGRPYSVLIMDLTIPGGMGARRPFNACVSWIPMSAPSFPAAIRMVRKWPTTSSTASAAWWANPIKLRNWPRKSPLCSTPGVPTELGHGLPVPAAVGQPEFLPADHP